MSTPPEILVREVRAEVAAREVGQFVAAYRYAPAPPLDRHDDHADYHRQCAALQELVIGLREALTIPQAERSPEVEAAIAAFRGLA
tara:strand:+ start:413 stop:670 length:258 start_codon:yes stop_codon:yes gene_type:complete